MKANPAQPKPDSTAWLDHNRQFLALEMQRLRLLLRRRVRWLRTLWQSDPLQNYHHMVITETQADRMLAGDTNQAAGHFYRQDSAARTATAEIEAIQGRIAAHAESMSAAGAPPALEVLIRLFGLSGFERDVLVLCLAPELDADFARLYAYVQDDARCGFATGHLALALFCDADHFPEAEQSLAAHAALRHFRLIRSEAGPLLAAPARARPLRLDERMVEYLQGINMLDASVAALVQPTPSEPLRTDHAELAERLARKLLQRQPSRAWPALQLLGPEGCGRQALTKAFCEHLGLQLLRLNLQRLPSTPTEQDEIRHLLEREAVLLQAAFYIDLAEFGGRDPVSSNTAKHLVERLNALVILGSRERLSLERDSQAVRLNAPDKPAQKQLWSEALRRAGISINGELDALVQQFSLGPLTITRAVANAGRKAGLDRPGNSVVLAPQDLWQSARELAAAPMDTLAQRIEPCYTWDDIVLPEAILGRLHQIAAQVAHRAVVYEAMGFGAKLSRGRGISALFSGASGTGKTMAAEILANHLALDLYRIDLAGVVSKYIGETEKNLKKVFDAAEASGAILFFDEADALFGKRTEVKDSHDRYANIEVNYLLQRMEDYRGLAILATNRRSALDRAFLRRLRFLVDFPFPDPASRKRIWQRVFPPQAKLNGIDYDVLARLDIAGGSIRNIALNGAFLAAGENQRIGMEHLVNAARQEYAKIDKMVTQAEFGPYYPAVRS